MTLQITMLIYSGNPDPTWELDGEEEQQLRRLLDDPPDTLRPITPYLLGYRGFSVVDPTIPDQPLVRRRSGDYVSEGFTGAPAIEAFLWRSARPPQMAPPDQPASSYPPPYPGDDSFTVGIEEPRRIVRAVTCPPSLAADAPAYDPDLWAPPVQGWNNCYNYGTNFRQTALNVFSNAYPGNQGRSNTGYWTVASIYSGAVADGLIPVRDFSEPRALGEGHYIAGVAAAGVDHHWYRQDDNGCWSHKVSSAPVRDTDQNGDRIANPLHCQRGPYSLFVGFFLVPPGTVVSADG